MSIAVLKALKEYVNDRIRALELEVKIQKIAAKHNRVLACEVAIQELKQIQKFLRDI